MCQKTDPRPADVWQLPCKMVIYVGILITRPQWRTMKKIKKYFFSLHFKKSRIFAPSIS